MSPDGVEGWKAIYYLSCMVNHKTSHDEPRDQLTQNSERNFNARGLFMNDCVGMLAQSLVHIFNPSSSPRSCYRRRHARTPALDAVTQNALATRIPLYVFCAAASPTAQIDAALDAAVMVRGDEAAIKARMVERQVVQGRTLEEAETHFARVDAANYARLQECYQHARAVLHLSYGFRLQARAAGLLFGLKH